MNDWSAEAWRRVVENAPEGIVICDAAARDCPVLFVNSSFVDMCGYPASALLGTNLRMLQGTDRVEPTLDTWGGTSTNGTHRPLLVNLRVDEAAALPLTGGCVVHPARPVLWPPPTPSRPVAHFPARHRL